MMDHVEMAVAAEVVVDEWIVVVVEEEGKAEGLTEGAGKVEGVAVGTLIGSLTIPKLESRPRTSVEVPEKETGELSRMRCHPRRAKRPLPTLPWMPRQLRLLRELPLRPMLLPPSLKERLLPNLRNPSKWSQSRLLLTNGKLSRRRKAPSST